ncbi:MAG: hypothetical protein U0W40_18865 [Acidimicrobiia bacterium]
MTPTDFSGALRTLSFDDIRDIATSIEHDSVGDEVDAWRITIAIDRTLRHSHRTRQAAQAAYGAAQAVQRAAEADGVELPHPQVTHVARAAAEVARGLVAGDDVAPEVSRLLLHWFPVLSRA